MFTIGPDEYEHLCCTCLAQQGVCLVKTSIFEGIFGPEPAYLSIKHHLKEVA